MSFSQQAITFNSIETPIAPILIACPHAGRVYNDALLAQTGLSTFDLRSLEDFYVDEFCEIAPSLGISFIKSNISRLYIDLNRNPLSIDNKLIEGAKNIKYCPYANAGIGIIPRQITKGREIYREKIKFEDFEQRRDNIHTPYHNAINMELLRLKEIFGRAILIDMHSMPKKSLGLNQADFIIGNNFSRSAKPQTSGLIYDFFAHKKYKVRMNLPYAGGYTTQFHANLPQNIEVLQIEINRALYFKEESQEKSEDFNRVKSLIADFLSFVITSFK